MLAHNDQAGGLRVPPADGFAGGDLRLAVAKSPRGRTTVLKQTDLEKVLEVFAKARLSPQHCWRYREDWESPNWPAAQQCWKRAEDLASSLTHRYGTHKLVWHEPKPMPPRRNGRLISRRDLAEPERAST